jgi:alkylation response protein AidB-like acyl-CoA dehydrogenase
MCLTEPQCGSDLNQVSTRAEPIGDGKYKINGTKIFISCGEHDMTNNIMHCVLARLPGAPEGTKGISLFLVPKHKVDDDGNISSEFNGANIGRIEDKMGCHGSSTCEINFEDAEGYLLGEENKGMNHMFTFINTSRLGTSIQGIAAAELSFQNALWYTKERRAFRALSGTVDADKVADPIIVHGDIRKNLLFQKAIAEGGRSMVYECAQLADVMAKALLAGDTKTHDAIDDRLGFMTPILKGFLTESGIEAASLGVQLYGGHGYIKSNKQEQVYRDVRISAIWEGTTGIQALDLLGRKIFKRREELKAIKAHCKILRNFAWEHLLNGATPEIKSHARTLYYKAIEWEVMTYGIGYRAKSDKNMVGVVSVDYLMYSGYVTLAQHWLRMEVVANQKLKEGKGNKELYDSKIKVEYYLLHHSFLFRLLITFSRTFFLVPQLYTRLFGPLLPPSWD